MNSKTYSQRQRTHHVWQLSPRGGERAGPLVDELFASATTRPLSHRCAPARADSPTTGQATAVPWPRVVPHLVAASVPMGHSSACREANPTCSNCASLRDGHIPEPARAPSAHQQGNTCDAPPGQLVSVGPLVGCRLDRPVSLACCDNLCGPWFPTDICGGP